MGMPRECRPAIVLCIKNQPNIIPWQVTENIEKNLESLKTSLLPDIRLTLRFSVRPFIKLQYMCRGPIEGLFCDNYLFLFLGFLYDNSLIANLFLCGAVLVLEGQMLDINTMSLGGYAIALVRC